MFERRFHRRRLHRQLIVAVAGWGWAATVGLSEEPLDPALSSSRPWTRFLAEAFPEGIDPERSQQPLTIRDPGSDTANYPNGPNTLWWGLVAEYNVGISDDSTQAGYQPVDVVQWAITKELSDDFQVFVHGFQNQSALPRLVAQTVVGAGFVWFPSDRLSVFGNWGFGTDKSGPASTFQAGLANSF